MNQEIADGWIRLPRPEDMAAARPPGHPYDFGAVAAMTRLIGAHPRIGPRFYSFFAQVMFGGGALSRAECEMVAAVAAVAQDCDY
jgi:alkylhydroperoxidase family enzyme